MANPNLDDDDEPTGPMRVPEDERDDYVPPVIKTSVPSIASSNDTVELRKLALEEMRFHLEERKEVHKMDMETRRVEQEERDEA